MKELLFIIIWTLFSFGLGIVTERSNHKCEVPEVKEDIAITEMKLDIQDLEEKLQKVIQDNGLYIAK